MTPPPPRSAVVDLGSNSVRLVVFEGEGRNPVPVLNERALLRLGSGLDATGMLNADGVARAVTVMRRYREIARAMRAAPMEVLATAAVRDAANGPDFVRALEAAMPGVPIRILSGEQEAAYSADGVLCGIPEADGLLADIGGGSLELVRLASGACLRAVTLKLGVIRLAERAGNDREQARRLADADLRGVPWLEQGAGGTVYLVGGAFRALARIHMAQRSHPLGIVHHYAIEAGEARDLAGRVAGAGRRELERLPEVSRRRLDDLPYAALVLRRLLRATGAARVVFSANGLREGWYMRRLPEPVRAEDPLLAACRESAVALGRDPALPPALFAWTAGLFPDETPPARRLRQAACWLSDIGSHDHPHYRAEQAFLRVVRQPGIALDHPDRMFLGLAVAYRYHSAIDPGCLAMTRGLVTPAAARRAEQLGGALRLAYMLSAGTPALLAGTAIAPEAGQLVLRAGRPNEAGNDLLLRRLRRLAASLDLAEARVVH